MTTCKRIASPIPADDPSLILVGMSLSERDLLKDLTSLYRMELGLARACRQVPIIENLQESVAALVAVRKIIRSYQLAWFGAEGLWEGHLMGGISSPGAAQWYHPLHGAGNLFAGLQVNSRSDVAALYELKLFGGFKLSYRYSTIASRPSTGMHTGWVVGIRGGVETHVLWGDVVTAHVGFATAEELEAGIDPIACTARSPVSFVRDFVAIDEEVTSARLIR